MKTKYQKSPRKHFWCLKKLGFMVNQQDGKYII